MAVVEGMECGEQWAIIENNKIVNVIRALADYDGSDLPAGQTAVRNETHAIGDSYDGSNFTVAAARQLQTTSSEWMELLRKSRNAFLSESDWTQNSDVTLANISAWNTYRQQLRDLPANTPDPSNVTWPTKPS